MQNSTKLSGQPIICQLLSFIPKELVNQAVEEKQSDRYYKTMTSYKQLVFMLYGIIGKASSLTSLCKNLLFLDGKLSYLGINKLPPKSTLSDANINRKSDVFEHLYYLLLDHYKTDLKRGFVCLPVNNEVACDKVKRFDATTFSLFSDVFKGAGRTPIAGKKAGGIKAQTILPYDSLTPDFVVLKAASVNDKTFLGQFVPEKGYTYVFDKGYLNYKVYQKWSEAGVYFVTRINDNASYNVIKSLPIDNGGILNNTGIIKDELIGIFVKSSNSTHILRLCTYRDPISGKLLKFLTNQFEYQALSIAQLYKNRWTIETFFKQLKQNFQLSYFYSDSKEGIQSQIWMALIANLIFTVIYQRVKECEQFTTIVGMARANMGSYVSFIAILQTDKLTENERDNQIIQLCIFENTKGGVFENQKISP